MIEDSLNNSFESNTSTPNITDYYHSPLVCQEYSNFNSLFNPILNNNELKDTFKTDIITNNIKKKGRKKQGQKTKRVKGERKEHDKYAYDNTLIKAKRLCITELLNFINTKIFITYNGKIGHGKNIKQLLLLKYDQIKNATIEYNKKFLNKTIGQIFSENLSGRINNYNLAHNRTLIENLKNEEDEEKKQYFNGLFSLTFSHCLKYFIGEDDNAEYIYMEGLKRFSDLENDDEFRKKNDEEYINHLKNFIKNYPEQLNIKKGRKSRKEVNEESDTSNYS